MNRFKLALIIFSIYPEILLAQPKNITVAKSDLMEIKLPSVAVLDQRTFFIAAAKTTLELEAGIYQVTILDVEVLSYLNSTGIKEDAKKWIEDVEAILKNNQYDLFPSEKDPSFFWLSKNGMNFLMYANAGKKTADVYFGRADRLPEVYHSELLPPSRSEIPSSNKLNSTGSIQNELHEIEKTAAGSMVISNNIKAELVGNWGNLSGAKVNWRDESTGYMLVSGVSKGYGLELKPDGSFLHTTVVTSGRPNYRVFVSTSGNWSVEKNQLILTPVDRHYRKWENEIIMIDEHSVPAAYRLFWMIKTHQFTSQECLYVKYDQEQEEWDELCREKIN